VLTIFTTPKPFRGHINIIQRNALKSWTLLAPGVEVILFGDDEGAAEAARDLGIRHEPYVKRQENGMKYLDYMFGRAQSIARHEVLCYVNCDIVLMADFPWAIDRVRTKHRKFLVVGRRWDTPIVAPIDFSQPNWADKVRSFALDTKDRRNHWWIDYFAFSREAYPRNLPPLVVGTVRWDNWLVWKALDSKLPVVDASPAVVAVHQNHDYSYHPQGKKGVWEGDESKRNLAAAGGWRHMRNISHATLELTPGGEVRSTWFRRRWFETRQAVRRPSTIWYSFLDLTLKARHAVGLNREGLAQLKSKLGARRNLD
jgi:hypothetical protein